MLRYEEWPPQPGKIELVLDFQQLAETENPERAHRELGQLVAHNLFSNMEPPTASRVFEAALAITERHLVDGGLSPLNDGTPMHGEFLHGVVDVISDRMETRNV